MDGKPTSPPQLSPWPAPGGQVPTAEGWTGSQQQLPQLAALPAQSAVSPPQTVVLQHSVPQRQVYGSYKARPATALGWILIACGILSIVFNIVGMFYVHFIFYFSHGLFCGIFYISAGALTVQAARRKTKCEIVGSLVLSILAAVFCWYQIGCSITSVLINSGTCYNGRYRYNYYNYCYRRNVALTMACLLLILGITAFVTAVWASALACGMVCCGATANNATPMTVQYVASPGPQQPQIGAVLAPQQPQIIVLAGVSGQPQVVQGPQAQPGQFQGVAFGPHVPPAYTSHGMTTTAPN